jgi:hypothetical protein
LSFNPAARSLGAGIARLYEGDFIEGHCLDAATSARIPKDMIGKRLSQRQAKKLLDSLERDTWSKKGAKTARRKAGPSLSH